MAEFLITRPAQRGHRLPRSPNGAAKHQILRLSCGVGHSDQVARIHVSQRLRSLRGGFYAHGGLERSPFGIV